MLWLSRLSAVVALAFLAACSSLPGDGPDSGSFQGQASEYIGKKGSSANSAPKFILADLTEDTVNTLLNYRAAQAGGAFTSRRGPADIRIGIGDVISVAIFEADSGGLFTPSEGSLSQGNFVNIPNQEVDHTGTIKIPFLGNVSVSGRRPSEVEAEIEAKLRDRAIEPQVVVGVAERRSARFTVVGEVNAPGVFQFSQSGERVMDAIGRAGGSVNGPYDTLVVLQSGGRETTVRLSELVNKSSNNIFLRPGDTLTLRKDRQVVTIFGATGKNGQISLDKENMSVADALAQAGGLLDGAADAKSIVIYRFVTREAVQAIGATLSEFPLNQATIPLVLRLDLSAAGGYFMAQAAWIEPGDLIYVSNAPLYELVKLNSVIQSMSSTITGVDSAYEAVR